MWLLVKNICGKRESSCKVVSAANSDSSAVSLPSYSVPITVLQAARHERISFSVWFSSHAQVTWTEVGHQIFSQRFSFILTFLSSLGYLLVPSGGVDVHHVCWGFMAVAHLDGLNSRGLWWSCVPRHIKSQIKQICIYIYIYLIAGELPEDFPLGCHLQTEVAVPYYKPANDFWWLSGHQESLVISAARLPKACCPSVRRSRRSCTVLLF